MSGPGRVSRASPGIRRCATVREMKEGPSGSAIRSRSQTADSDASDRPLCQIEFCAGTPGRTALGADCSAAAAIRNGIHRFESWRPIQPVRSPPLIVGGPPNPRGCGAFVGLGLVSVCRIWPFRPSVSEGGPFLIPAARKFPPIAVSSIAGFRTPAVKPRGTTISGRHPKPSTGADSRVSRRGADLPILRCLLAQLYLNSPVRLIQRPARDAPFARARTALACAGPDRREPIDGR